MDRDIEKFTAYQMSVVTHLVNNRHNLELSNYGITRAQGRVIYMLERHGDLMQSELQKKLYVQASTMNGIIESLLKNALIKRRASRKDRRTKVISLTQAGVDLGHKLWSELHKLDDDLMANFTEEEKGLMISWLKRMQSNLQQKEEMEPGSTDEKKEGR
ncbi:MarR family transcriptional regulator [Salipaludibacillus keqinensis]|uniref:MarR family transcriptional regulator n=1 Tax=Salipaludibacillus keqinensis TaxID=2045207 RepID=A0A323TCY8_9BACI|nr:MarR family transcriptional regulator [Salipaludibacillus keqinensis]PYZ92064.1 MarR family transcriptional regulator [Salipaludibacillus keqinensis]